VPLALKANEATASRKNGVNEGRAAATSMDRHPSNIRSIFPYFEKEYLIVAFQLVEKQNPTHLERGCRKFI
jgi:hypothetical protein